MESTDHGAQFAVEVQSAFAERTVKRLTILSGLLTVALIINAAVNWIVKR